MFLRGLALGLGLKKGELRDDGTGRRSRHSFGDRGRRRSSARSTSDVTMTMDGLSQDAFFNWDDQEATAHAGPSTLRARNTGDAYGGFGTVIKDGRARDGRKKRNVGPGFDAAKPGASKEGTNEVLLTSGSVPASRPQATTPVTPVPVKVLSAVPRKLQVATTTTPASVDSEPLSMQPLIDGEAGRPIATHTPSKDPAQAGTPLPSASISPAGTPKLIAVLDATALKRAGKMHRQAVIDTWVACQTCLTQREQNTNARLQRERKRCLLICRPSGASICSSRPGDTLSGGGHSDDVPTLTSATTATGTTGSSADWRGIARGTAGAGPGAGAGASGRSTPQARSRSNSKDSRTRPKLATTGRRRSSVLGIRYEDLRVDGTPAGSRPESRLSVAAVGAIDIEAEEEREFQLLA